MRILQVCKKFPYPPHDGEAIAILNLTKAFHHLAHPVTILAINTPKHHFNPAHLPPAAREMADFHALEVNTNLHPTHAFLNLFSGKSYNIERFHSAAFHQALAQLLQQQTFDLIQLETAYLGPYVKTIRQHCDAPIVLRAHNVEFEIWERMAANQPPGLKKVYLQLLARRLKRYEIGMLNAYDAVVPITERDADRFRQAGCRKPLFVSPAGIDTAVLHPAPLNTAKPSICFLGGLDWLPNREGVLWFLENAWPMLHRQHPELTFALAGRNMPRDFFDLPDKYPGLAVKGAVSEAPAFLNAHPIMIVPLFAGSGMRIKIIEAMALGRVVISTTLGAEGIAAQPGEHFLLADTAPEFVKAINWCLENPQRLPVIGRSARQFVAAHFDIQPLAGELVRFYQKLRG